MSGHSYEPYLVFCDPLCTRLPKFRNYNYKKEVQNKYQSIEFLITKISWMMKLISWWSLEYKSRHAQTLQGNMSEIRDARSGSVCCREEKTLFKVFKAKTRESQLEVESCSVFNQQLSGLTSQLLLVITAADVVRGSPCLISLIL